MSARKVKTIRATMFDPAFTVEIEPLNARGLPNSKDIAVFLDGVEIGTVTPFYTHSERKVGGGSRLVRRGPQFKAWAQRELHGDRFDYYAQTPSMSAAIRRLVDDYRLGR